MITEKTGHYPELVEADECTPNAIITEASDACEKVDIRRGSLKSITVFDVTEEELNRIESGAENNIYNSLFLVFLGVSISMFISWLTVELSSDVVKQCIFYCFWILSSIVTILMLILWLNCRQSVQPIIKQIKGRVM